MLAAPEPLVELSTNPPPLRWDDPELLGAPELSLLWLCAEAILVDANNAATTNIAEYFLIA
jgi:hypothetical protein